MGIDCRWPTTGLPSAILDAHEKPVWMVGFDFRVVEVNQAFRRLLPVSEPIVGRKCYEVSHGRTEPCSSCEVTCPLRRARVQDETFRSIHRHRTAAGDRQFEIESRGVLSVERGSRVGALMVLHPAASLSCNAVPAALAGSAWVTRRLRDHLLRVAPTELPVLLIGEPGTRKGSVALALHQMSARAGGGFEQVGGDEVRGSDLYCEIFGCRRERTDSRSVRRTGRIEACRGGTLVISDVDALPKEVLPGLARLASRGLFRPRGDLEWSAGDVRLIFSTAGTRVRGLAESPLRQEPSLAMAVCPIEIPPLRARLEDLEEIVERMAAEDPTCEFQQLDPGAWDLLSGYDFPGNLRELETILKRASVLAGAKVIRPCDLPGVAESLSLQTRPVRWTEGVVPLADFGRRYLVWADRVSDGTRSDLARRLGISERALYRRLRRIRGSRRGSSPR